MPLYAASCHDLHCLFALIKQIFKEVWKLKLVTPENIMQIPCSTCPTWSHFIQDKLKISIYLSLDKCKICIKLIIMSSHVALKTVWILISWLLQKPADLDLHCLQES